MDREDALEEYAKSGNRQRYLISSPVETSTRQLRATNVWDYVCELHGMTMLHFQFDATLCNLIRTGEREGIRAVRKLTSFFIVR